jgi:hypothetical protein
MKRFLFFFICLVFSIGCSAQFSNFAVEASVVFPFLPDQKQTSDIRNIPTSYSDYQLQTSWTESFEKKAGFKIGAKVDYKITPKIFITTALNFQQVRYKHSTNFNNQFPLMAGIPGVPYTFGGISIRDPATGVIVTLPEGSPLYTSSEPSNKLGNTELYYVQMPVTVGISLSKKFAVSGGLLFSQLINARVQKQSLSLTSGPSEKVEDSDDDFTALSYGAVLEVSYLLTKNISADFSMSRNFNSLYTGTERNSEKTKLNLISLGLGYRF